MTEQQTKALAPLIAKRNQLAALPADHNVITAVKILDGIIGIFDEPPAEVK